MVILPQTRNVFLGWLKTYVSVALWPMLFAFAERLALAIPWTAWIGSLDGSADPWAMTTSFLQGEIMLVIFNAIAAKSLLCKDAAPYDGHCGSDQMPS